MNGNVKEFYTGVGLMIGFVIVLILFFLPLLDGKNGLDYLDNLYNSISKGSAHFIPKVRGEAKKFDGHPVSAVLVMKDNRQAEETALLLKAGGGDAVVTDKELKVRGDLGKILENCLNDADMMYRNEGAKVSGKYGYNEKRVLYNWWEGFKAMDKSLSKEKKFKETEIIAVVVKKAVETSYNYYKIEPQKIGERWGTVVFSLLFYVIYTLWYGFGILFMFEGWGLRLSH
jgi:hypothetical protein